jgi:hypothetical protein
MKNTDDSKKVIRNLISKYKNKIPDKDFTLLRTKTLENKNEDIKITEPSNTINSHRIRNNSELGFFLLTQNKFN